MGGAHQSVPSLLTTSPLGTSHALVPTSHFVPLTLAHRTHCLHLWAQVQAQVSVSSPASEQPILSEIGLSTMHSRRNYSQELPVPISLQGQALVRR